MIRISLLFQARKLRQDARKRGLDIHFVAKHLGKEIKDEAKDVDIFEDGSETEAEAGQEQGRLVRVKKRVKKRPGQKINRNKFRHTSYLGSELMYKFLDQLDRQVNMGSIIIAVQVFIARA